MRICFLLSSILPTVYVPSMADPKQLINLAVESDQVTKDHVAACVLLQMPKWDSFMRSVNDDLRELIIKAMHKDLAIELMTYQPDFMSAPDLLMLIWETISSTSMEKYERMREQLKALSPLKEPGQNIRLYTAKARKISLELYRAGQWQPLLLLSIYRALISVTNTSFRTFAEMEMRTVSALLKTIMMLSTEAGWKRLVDAGFEFQKIFAKYDDEYETLKANGVWEAAKIPTDPGGAPISLTAQQIEALVSQRLAAASKASSESAPTSPDGPTCWGCGKRGHIQPHCPDKSKSSLPVSTPAAASKPALTKTDWRRSNTTGKSWTIHNNKIYFWCPRCNRGKGFWTCSHRVHGQKPDLTPAQLKEFKKIAEKTGSLPEAHVFEVFDPTDGIYY